MPSNIELELTVRRLTNEVDALKEVLSQIFSHPDQSMEIRKRWNAFLHPQPELPVSEPKPPEKGEAQRSLETINQLLGVIRK